jgi:predicted metal-dependent enzyme (double-stranded beta helix superfamily)
MPTQIACFSDSGTAVITRSRSPMPAVAMKMKPAMATPPRATRHGRPAAITRQVKQELEDAIRGHTIRLPERFHRVRTDGYARRLLHRNDDLGYTAVVMTWGPGQRTPLHDHAGIWCVEGVVSGQMDVTQFDLVDESGDGVRFEARGCVQASVGSAGCLIPPFEYHILANALSTPSITLHVYGGEMTTCHVFEPADNGRYVRRERPLSYQE